MLDTATQLTSFVGMRTFIVLNAVGFGLNKMIPKWVLTSQFDSILTRLENILETDKNP